ncbi:hypothetical protein [Nonomuraea fuscirosea]|uniref:hypothetical protein n=1 Tax=Nonomuraea fuscirosea TaxID=1291556 RepID=UPI003406C6FD
METTGLDRGRDRAPDPVAAAGLGAWYGSDQGIKVVHYGTSNTRVLAVEGDLVTLEQTPETGKPGTYWLKWTGAFSMLGDVVSRAQDRVTRKVLRGPAPSVGTPGYFGSVPPGDPEVAWGIGHTEIMVPTELGPAPAWYVPGGSDTWFVAVHGQNGLRKAELKILPVVHRLGLPFMAISYRNDEGAPPSPDGLLHLGDSEWRDLEAALRQARTMGARRFILYGTSMGCQIAGQFLARSPPAGLPADPHRSRRRPRAPGGTRPRHRRPRPGLADPVRAVRAGRAHRGVERGPRPSRPARA